MTAWQCPCELWNAAHHRKCRNCARWKRAAMGLKDPHAVALGRKGGKAGKGVSTPAKASAARRNGRLGGAPNLRLENARLRLALEPFATLVHPDGIELVDMAADPEPWRLALGQAAEALNPLPTSKAKESWPAVPSSPAPSSAMSASARKSKA